MLRRVSWVSCAFLVFYAVGAMPAAALEIQGHRGARAARPENTLPAFEHGLEVGADVLELDLLVTRDDQLVIGHDPILNPEICLDPSGKPLAGEVLVRSLRLEELQRYDCGSLRHPRFPRQVLVPKTKMPTLSELFALVRARKDAARVRFNVEIKSVPGRPELGPPPEAFAKLLVDLLAKEKMSAQVVVQSFDHRTLREVHRLNKDLAISALTSDNYLDYVAIARGLGAKIISPDQLWITAEAVKELHAAGVRVIPWTANSEAEWARLIGLGVDGIITDDPEGLRRYLSARRP
ncbi:MAG: glycerophosphodiester phosphodiesterase [Myxococcota bacterium]